MVIDGDTAEGELGARIWHLTIDGVREFVAFGRYVDLYEKREGVWRFARRAFVLDWTEDRTIGQRDDFGTEGVAMGRAEPDDPVYDRLPMFGRDRRGRRGQGQGQA